MDVNLTDVPQLSDLKPKAVVDSLQVNGSCGTHWVQLDHAKSDQQPESIWKEKNNEAEQGDKRHVYGFRVDNVALVASLRACAKQKDLSKGMKIHSDIRRSGVLETNLHVVNVLINMYAKCGALEKAQEVFDGLPERNAVSWNVLISGYVQQGHDQAALNCFEKMQSQGFPPNAVTLTSVLKACGSIRSAEKGQQTHAEVIRRGLVEKDAIVCNAMLDMYAKCGEFLRAKFLFDGLHIQNLVSWNSLISGYAQHGQGQEALNCYNQMQQVGFLPNDITFLPALKACGSEGASEKGKEIHSEILRQKLLEKNGTVGNALVDMYAKCGTLAKAQEVFDMLPIRNVISWNALISGYSQHEHSHEALERFDQMQNQGFHPDAVTYTSILNACGSLGVVEKGKAIHSEVARQGLLAKDMILCNAVMDMYAKCGELAKAREVFDQLPFKNVVSWNALICGYAQHGDDCEALNCFEQMQHQGPSPNVVTYLGVLKACASIGAAENGKEIHDEIVRQGLLKKDGILGTSLVDMYVKCGELSKAQEVFDELLVRDVVAWSAIIAGYAQLGKIDIAFDTFIKMVTNGVTPNEITFLVLLNACAHAGLVKEGQTYFTSMRTIYGLEPTGEHRSCMVDLYGRAGHFDEAVVVIEDMPNSDTCDHLSLWYSLLGACRKWGNVNFGKLAFDNVIKLDEKNPAPYVAMHNIYEAASMHVEAEEIEAMRVKNKVWKMLGCWSVD